MPVISGSGSGGGGVTVVAYVEITSNVSVVSVSEAAPTAVVSAGAQSFDGVSLYTLEFYCEGVLAPATAQRGCIISLWDASTNLGRWGAFQTPAAASGLSTVFARRYLTPSAGSHTYQAQAWCTPDGSGTIFAGSGGSGTSVPAYIRVTKGS